MKQFLPWIFFDLIVDYSTNIKYLFHFVSFNLICAITDYWMKKYQLFHHECFSYFQQNELENCYGMESTLTVRQKYFRQL